MVGPEPGPYRAPEPLTIELYFLSLKDRGPLPGLLSQEGAGSG